MKKSQGKDTPGKSEEQRGDRCGWRGRRVKVLEDEGYEREGFVTTWHKKPRKVFENRGENFWLTLKKKKHFVCCAENRQRGHMQKVQVGTIATIKVQAVGGLGQGPSENSEV